MQKSLPDSPSLPEKLTVTSVLFHPYAFAVGVRAALAVGGVLSMLIPVTAAFAELPARSVQVPFADWLAPSLDRIVGEGGLPAANPDSESLQVKLTVTSLLFQPLAFAAGEGDPLMLGSVLSIFTAGEVKVAVFPAKSETVTVPVTAAPSEVSTRGLTAGFVVSTPERLSEALNPNETSELFHPFTFGTGDGAPKVSVGAVLSILMPLAVAAALTFPALSVHVPEAD